MHMHTVLARASAFSALPAPAAMHAANGQSVQGLCLSGTSIACLILHWLRCLSHSPLCRLPAPLGTID